MKRNIVLIVFVLVLATIISYFLIEANEKQFQQSTWNNYPTERYTMRKNIIKSELLIGKTKQEVIRLLGDPKVSNLTGKEHLIYSLGKVPSFFESDEMQLIVIFEDDVANKVIYAEK